MEGRAPARSPSWNRGQAEPVPPFDEADSNLLASLTAPQHSVAYTYEPNRNAMTAIKNHTGGATLLSSYAYTYDALGRRADREQSGSAFTATNKDTFAYNARSEVEGSTNDILTAAEYAPGYTYDQIGNRLTATGGTLGTDSATYTSNELNQYVELSTSGSPLSTPNYDADGNLLSDSAWTYTWDGENRLINADNGTITIDFVYDYQGRLVKKDDGTHVEIYVYNGWNRIATFDASNLPTFTLAQRYLWGLDLSGSSQGAGGVGGLLKEGSYYPTYDANGNVMQKLDATGATVMNVEYDPFGNIINGTLVGEYGFSTKPLIENLDWYYYGFRYYDAETGRWPSRDPLGEQFGFNIYAIIANEIMNSVDFLGLARFNGDGWKLDELLPKKQFADLGKLRQKLQTAESLAKANANAKSAQGLKEALESYNEALENAAKTFADKSTDKVTIGQIGEMIDLALTDRYSVLDPEKLLELGYGFGCLESISRIRKCQIDAAYNGNKECDWARCKKMEDVVLRLCAHSSSLR